MRILFTGASSFTGYWFVKALASAGHEVVAIFSQRSDAYEGIRLERVKGVEGLCKPVFSCVFGSEAFMSLLQSEAPFDVFCHHAADVTNYRSADFDVAAALAANTRSLPKILRHLSETGCHRLLLTGSIFESGEGQGSDGLTAFSPYGLSKALTSSMVEYYAEENDMHFGKFVIPNPFGPLEEPRFTAYLVNTWARGEIAEVKTPAYIRDNIHVDLLAACYARFVGEMPSSAGRSKLNPSGYIESQGAFAERFASNLRARTQLPCGLTLARQIEFSEPRIRVNHDVADGYAADWSEQAAWDALARFYAPVIEASRA